MSALAEPAVTVSELVAAVRREQSTAPTPGSDFVQTSEGAGDRVCVVAAHAGAGATAVAVAMADALAGAGDGDAVLIDAAPAGFSGMLAAAEREVDSGIRDWREGRRGTIRVLRPDKDGSAIVRPDRFPTTSSRAVVDRGCPIGDLGSLDLSSPVVVVTRATVPGVQRAEHSLAGLPSDPFVAVVGARRWPRELVGVIGSRVADATHDGRVVFFPHDRRLAIRGVDIDPLPGRVVAAAARLVALVWPDLPARETEHRWKGLRR